MDENLVEIMELRGNDDVNFYMAFLEDYGFEIWQDQRPKNNASPIWNYVLKVKESDAPRALKFIEDLRNSTPVDEV